jgi:hypothetical protein
MEHYLTNNYDIYFKPQIYTIETNLVVELIRRYFYNLLKSYFIILCESSDIIISESKNDIKLSEIFAYFIFNSSNRDDPILTDKPNYNINTIKNLIKNTLRKNPELLKIFIKKMKIVLPKVSTRMKDYYNEYLPLVDKYKDTNIFKINKVYNDESIIILSLEQIGEYFYEHDSLSFSIHISLYKHLIKLYSIRNYNIFQIDEDLNYSWINEFDENVFILYCRYNYLASGSSQATIQPQFKKRLLEQLNIKFELFGSAINSSYTHYCSLFYDIEKYFGSCGSFFDTNLIAGYYEANPPFEKNIIHNMFGKFYKELEMAEKNKRGLLFFIIIPQMNLKEIPTYKKLNKFLKYLKLMDKGNIPYVYYDSSFSFAITRSIINTYVIIYHTTFIKDPIKNNVINSSFLLS